LIGKAVLGLALTEEQITAAMARAEKVACRPGDDRCWLFPYTPRQDMLDT
jgi:hypothetical protein